MSRSEQVVRVSDPPQTSSASHPGCPNCIQQERELQQYKSWEEFFEWEVANADDEEELVKSILVWVRTRHLQWTGRHVSLTEYIEAAEQNW